MRPTLAYLPMLYHHDKGMWPPTISSTLYFKLQDALWDFFDNQRKCRVIWNSGLPNSNLEDPMKFRRSKVIRYTTWNIRKVLSKCDMVVLDFPSTAVLDCVRAKKPFLCFPLWDHDWIRPFSFIWKMYSYEGMFYYIGTLVETYDILDIVASIEKLHVNDCDWLKRIAG